MVTFRRQRNLAPKPKPQSFPADPLPDPYAEGSPDLANRSRRYLTKRGGFRVETLGAPLPRPD